jgi:pyruvate dehydrogenase E2 component (dihydrolipoamide acetyltransferase)
MTLATKVVMPTLGMQQDTGTLIAWLKDEGESIVQGEPIMEIETDKVTVEIEAPTSGIIGGICAREGDVIPVGQTMAWILEPGESVPGEVQNGQLGLPSVLPAARRVAQEHGATLTPVSTLEGRIRGADVLETASSNGGPRLFPASPKARRLARERGLDTRDLVGTGPGGAVLAADVLAVGTQTLEPGTLWQVMAEPVTQSWTNTPHLYLLREVNASRLRVWRQQLQKLIEPQLTYSDLLVKLVAAALTRHKLVNASWAGGKIVLHHEINIGLAVATKDGLVVPVIHRADELELSQIAVRREDIISRAQIGKLSVADLARGTFTLSNLGMYGVDAFSAVVNPPQAAILTVGRIVDRVVAINGQPAVQPMMTLGLSCDHRVIDGARAAQFLDTLTILIEEPLLQLE